MSRVPFNAGQWGLMVFKENYMTDEQPSLTKEAYFSDVRKMAQFVLIDNEITTWKEWFNMSDNQKYHIIYKVSKDVIWTDNMPYIFGLLRFTTDENFNDVIGVGQESYDKDKNLNQIMQRVAVYIYGKDVIDEIIKLIRGD